MVWLCWARRPDKVFEGNRPSSTRFSWVVWNVNSFDQWRVALGKELANKLTPIVADGRRSMADVDSSTAGLIAAARKYGEG
jgi:hypothetical protein